MSGLLLAKNRNADGSIRGQLIELRDWVLDRANLADPGDPMWELHARLSRLVDLAHSPRPPMVDPDDDE